MNLEPDPDYRPDIAGSPQEHGLTPSAPAARGSFRASNGAAPGIKVKSPLESLNWASGELIAEINKVFQSDYQVRRALKAADQALAMQRMGVNRRSVEGLGRVRCEIDEELASMLRAQYGHDCLRQPDFLKFLERQYPHLFKVECTGTRVQVGWQPAMKSQTQTVKRQSLANPTGLIAARN